MEEVILDLHLCPRTETAGIPPVVHALGEWHQAWPIFWPPRTGLFTEPLRHFVIDSCLPAGLVHCGGFPAVSTNAAGPQARFPEHP